MPKIRIAFVLLACLAACSSPARPPVPPAVETAGPATAPLDSPPQTAALPSTETLPPAATLSPTIEPTPTGTASPTPTHTPDGREAEIYRTTDDLQVFMSHLENFMPKSGSEGFLNPDPEDLLAFRSFTEAILAGSFGNLLDLAPAYDYEILRVSDEGDGLAESYLLREPLPYKRGWGLFVFRKDPLNDILIEIPHPLFDENTDRIGLDLYRLLDARALLIAGAHRSANADGSSDASHNPLTVFEAVHEALTDTGYPLVLQIHGFASDQRPDYPQVILGEAAPEFGPDLAALSSQLAERGISAGVCNGILWTDLCGETNIQRSMMRAGIFVHIELAPGIRNDPALFYAVLSSWLAGLVLP